MELGVDQEIQAKDTIRSIQRDGLVLGRIKDQPTREFIQAFIPSTAPINIEHPNFRKGGVQDFAFYNELNPQFKNNLPILTNSLGEDTHSILFGLASTARNPQELANIFLVLSHLDIVDGEKITASENRFLRRHQYNINPSDGYIENVIRTGILDYFDPKQPTRIFDNARPHLLENFLYIISSKRIPQKDKERILKQLYGLKREMRDAVSFGNDPFNRTIFSRDTSFWRNVDGSWISPDLHWKPTIKEEKLHATKEGADPVRALLEMEKQKNAQLASSIAELQRQLTNAQSQLSTMGIENQRLRQRLNEIGPQSQSIPTRRSGEISPFEILKVSPTATPDQIKKAYRKIMLALHSDHVVGQLRNTQLKPEAIDEILNLVNGRMQDVNLAMEQLRRMGKVK